VADLGDEDLARVEARAALLEMLLGVAKHAYARIASGEVLLAALCLRPWRSGVQLHPLTGLVGGFLKSLARELPGSLVKVVHTDDADPRDALARLESELGAGPLPAPVEVAFRGGRRSTFALLPLEPLALGNPLARGSVVVATGGARGGPPCSWRRSWSRVCAAVPWAAATLTPSPPTSEPPTAAFAAREPAFYEAEMARSGARLPELARWEATGPRASGGVLAGRPPAARSPTGAADATDAAAVDAAIAQVARASTAASTSSCTARACSPRGASRAGRWPSCAGCWRRSSKASDTSGAPVSATSPAPFRISTC
jgi:hypothetical protein